jgi:iron complex outermembrane receptor protein
MNEVATGGFDFNDPDSNSQAVWDRIAPVSSVYSVSRLWQVQATIARDLMELAGGALQGAVGASFRNESINAPSANPADDSAPYSRYYGINSVGTAGERDVTSLFFEIDAPITETFDVIASGRYDDYSSGQSNFSPKVGLKWDALETLVLRGTWSQGFRIPSFNEAYGLPTTGYVTRSVDCDAYADFCAQHGDNAYATNPYSLGLTQTGDPALDPEESDSFTAGIIWQATESLQMTLDFWKIEVDGLITGVTDTSEAEAQYYSNNGIVNIPGITVLPGTPDTAYPNALPLAGFIQSSYTNQDSQEVSGVDFSATYMMPIGSVEWTSLLSLSYLAKYDLITDDGVKYEYAGTLSPCNITSCSGAPEWRGYWTNTIQWEKLTTSLTAYYTSSVDNASTDYGGIPGDCEANIYASVIPYVDGTPSLCKSKAQWNFDLTAQYQLNDKLQLFADVMNVFDIEPEFDPSAAYSLYGFNPAWAGPNIMGRFFRLGVRVDFE